MRDNFSPSILHARARFHKGLAEKTGENTGNRNRSQGRIQGDPFVPKTPSWATGGPLIESAPVYTAQIVNTIPNGKKGIHNQK